MIGRKQSSSHSDWVRALAESRIAPDHARAHSLVRTAASRITARAARGEPVMAWSGGKDSIALQAVAEAAGVRESFIVLSRLEYPAFLDWVQRYSPAGLIEHTRTGIDLDWLRNNPAMLFPQTSETAARWFQRVQHAGQRDVMREYSKDSILLLGRRTQDGNYCGPVEDNGGRGYVDRTGFTRFCPLWDWSHEDVLNVVASFDLSLPPIYDWPDGFRVGTGPWAARQHTDSRAAGWRAVLDNDLSVVEHAARYDIPGARSALDGRK